MPRAATRPIGAILAAVLMQGGLIAAAVDVPAASDSEPVPLPITVELASGRTLKALLDSQTDQQQLWLRWQPHGAELRRPIRWDRVVTAKIDAQTLPGHQLQSLVASIRRGFPRKSPPTRIVSAPAVAPPAIATAEAGQLGQAAAVGVTARRLVQAVAIDAWTAQWDADVEVDGLLVELVPLDGHGATVAVRGVLQAELWGADRGALTTRQSLVHLGRWTRSVSPGDFGPSGAVYRLPFRGIHPEYDLSVEPYGLLHVRLNVPGQGTFDALADTIRIRPEGVLRERLQRGTGCRFPPTARTGQGRP